MVMGLIPNELVMPHSLSNMMVQGHSLYNHECYYLFYLQLLHILHHIIGIYMQMPVSWIPNAPRMLYKARYFSYISHIILL